MEGTSSVDAVTSSTSGECTTPASATAVQDSVNPAPQKALLDNLQQFAYQPSINKRSQESGNATDVSGSSGISQTAAFLNDIRKRWQQHTDQEGPPAKISRTDETCDNAACSAAEDGETSTLSVAVDGDNKRDVPLMGVSPIPGEKERRKRGKAAIDKGSISDYSNSDDDKPSPPTPKSEGSNYEPSSAPTSDSEEVDADEGLSEEGASEDEYKPPQRARGTAMKKKVPVITALAFLANNRSSGSENEEAKGGDEAEGDASGSGQGLLKAKNSFEMLRRLRAMRQKKDIETNGEGKSANSVHVDPGDASSSRRRSSVDEHNVDRGVTERYALSRKRQVVLSDDEDTNSNSSHANLVHTQARTNDKSPTIVERSARKASGTLKKTVVYSSSDESIAVADDGNDEEDDGASNDKPEQFPFPISVSKKPNRTEVQEMCVQFFNDSSAAQLASIPRCSERIAEALIAFRPFRSFDHLLEEMDNVKVKGSSTQIIVSYLQIVEWQNDLDRLLQACQCIADHLQSSVDHLLAGDSATSATICQPALINDQYSLKPYQVLGLNWLNLMYRNNLNAILADEMGLGKTVQVIAFLAHLKQENVNGPHIVVVPSSTMDNWLNEFHRWCQTLNVLTYYGSLEDRKFLRKEIQTGRQTNFDVVLSTYRVITSNADDRAFFKRLNAVYAVFDEAHMLKSCNTARYKSLMKIKAKHRLLLTGTPLQNNLVELVSLLHFVMPSLFRDHTDNLKDILNLFQAKNGSLGEYEQAKIEQAKQIMKPFVLRRLKADVLSQLPEKRETIETCQLTGRQAELYGSLVAAYAASVTKDEQGEHSDAKGMFMQLRKVANHPLLVRSLYTDDQLQEMAKALKKEKSYRETHRQADFEDLAVLNDFQLHRMCKQHRTLNSYKLKPSDIDHSAKLVALDRILPEIKSQGNKVLLFSQFTMVLDIVEEFLKTRKYKYLRLDGSTPVVERQLMIDNYNNTPSLFAFLLSTRAGGLGINLTSANTIILHDIDYNPYNDKQAEDRCHRVGQTKEVTVIRLIAKNTVDETMLACAQKKLQLEQQITGADDEDDENSRDVESLLKLALKL